jgi:hypothetical protein
MLRCNFHVNGLMTGLNHEGTFKTEIEELKRKLKQTGMVLRIFVTNRINIFKHKE